MIRNRTQDNPHIQGLPPGRILYCKIPLVFHNGTTSNHRAGLILRWAQLQWEASWFTALPEAALYTTAFSRDFQSQEGRLSSLWLAGTNITESLKFYQTREDSPQSVNKQTNNTFNKQPTGDRDRQLLREYQRKNTSMEVLLGNANVLHLVFLFTLGWENLLEARTVLLPS